MSRSLEGRTALITGSTSGLGKAMAEALAAQGCHIVLNGFGPAEDIRRLEDQLKTAHQMEVLYHGADLSRPAEIRDLMAAALQRFGAIDILVNNAGFQFVAALEEFPEEKWDGMLAVNLSAAFHTTKTVLPGMRAQKWGRIVNIASAHGLVASPFKSAYVATKHGLVGLTKVTALETARDGITCNAICPGFVHTAVVDKQIAEQARVTGLPPDKIIEDVILVKHANRAFVTVEQVAALAVFLCSEAGASMTGASLSMDGGWTTA